VFLPPLLYSAAFFTSPQEWKENWRPISALAIGLVLATLVAVAGVAVAVIAGVGWATAFVLGAVVAPTDPVAASGVIGRLRAPPRLRTILEGESLVNDGVALVIYAVAVEAAVSGSFSLLHGVGLFFGSSVGGVAIGLVVGLAVATARRRIHDPMVEITISLVTPYLAYLPAELAHVSGILATVTTGTYLGARSDGLFRAETRVRANAVWDTFRFLLESTLFVLLGTQFAVVVGGLDSYSSGSLVVYAAAVFGAVVLVRIAWQSTVPHVFHALDLRFRETRSSTPWQQRLILGWSGMRGAVTLAAALSIPRAAGNRQLVLFLAFSVIVLTIVIQGTTLPWLIRRLGVARPEGARRQELEARVKLAEAALDELERLAADDDVDSERVEPLRQIYQERIDRNTIELEQRGGDGDGGGRTSTDLQLDLIGAQRQMLRRLTDEGSLDPQTGRRLEGELDLEESRAEAAP
jgi:CPA1 family monovalent cation:H+ antiporter